LTVLGWVLHGLAWVLGTYFGIVVVFALYFALASYLPILARKARSALGGRGRSAAR